MTDNTDRKILFELNWNCRQPYSVLGKKVHVSKQVVAYRIAQLEKNGIILGYNILVDWRKLGYNATRIYLKWHKIDPKKEEEIYQFMKNDPFFMWTVKFEGEFDIGFYVWVKSVHDFAERWFSFLEKYGRYILKQEISESVDMIHYPMKPLSTSSKKEEIIIGNGEKSKYDEIDYSILKHLAKNAQVSVVGIGKSLNLTPKAIIYRIKNLEKNGIILGYNGLIDVEKIGYSFYKIDFYLNDISRIEEMFEFAKSRKEIVYRMRTIGGPQFEIEVMVEGAVEMKKLITEIREKFKSTIENFRFHRFEYTIKQVYLPGER